MDSIRVSEAPDSGSIPDEATREDKLLLPAVCPFLFLSKALLVLSMRAKASR